MTPADHGGKFDFIRWAGLDTSNGYIFYTDGSVRDIFKAYIKVLLEHVNQFTGVRRPRVRLRWPSLIQFPLIGCTEG